MQADARGLAAGARSPAPDGPLFLAARDPARRAPGSLHAGDDRALAGARVGRAGRARGRRQGHCGHRPGGHRLPRRALRLDTRLAAPEAARRVVAYAEPLPVNEILLPPHKWPRSELVAAVRSLGAAFPRHARKPYVLKLTSWNTLFCDLVAEAFPETPWVLCLRDPLEVAVSLLRQPAGWIWNDGGEPAAPFAKYVDPEGVSRSREEYLARIFAAFCGAACRLDPSKGRLLNTRRCPGQCGRVSRRTSVSRSMAPHASAWSRRRARMPRRPFRSPRNSPPTARPSRRRHPRRCTRPIDALARPALLRLQSRHAAAAAMRK